MCHDEAPILPMDDEMKRLANLEEHVERLGDATVHIQDCIKILIRIFETKALPMLAQLKEDYKKLQTVTSNS